MKMDLDLTTWRFQSHFEIQQLLMKYLSATIRSQFVGESVRVVEMLAVIRGLWSDKEVVMIEDLVQGQDPIKIVVASGEQVVNFVLNKNM